ncbi:MAG: CHAD domain-containing protein [Capsulimonadaceae bacterium]
MAKAFPLLAVDPAGRLAENAPLMLHIRLAEMYRFAPYVRDPERVQELHDMRIAAKRLRYTMEVFASCASDPEFSALYEIVKGIQELIGDIHDCDVRVPLMLAHLDSTGTRRPEIKIGIDRAVAAERARRLQLYEKFCRLWTRLETRGFRRRFLEMLARLDGLPAPVDAVEVLEP